MAMATMSNTAEDSPYKDLKELMNEFTPESESFSLNVTENIFKWLMITRNYWQGKTVNQEFLQSCFTADLSQVALIYDKLYAFMNTDVFIIHNDFVFLWRRAFQHFSFKSKAFQ